MTSTVIVPIPTKCTFFIFVVSLNQQAQSAYTEFNMLLFSYHCWQPLLESVSILPPAEDKRYVQPLLAVICNLCGGSGPTSDGTREVSAWARLASCCATSLRSSGRLCCSFNVPFPPFRQFNLFPAVKIFRLFILVYGLWRRWPEPHCAGAQRRWRDQENTWCQTVVPNTHCLHICVNVLYKQVDIVLRGILVWY